MMVAFEGIDGSGKSTQLQLLATTLQRQGEQVVTVPRTAGRPIRVVYKELIRTPDAFPSPLSSLFLALADYTYAFQAVVRSTSTASGFDLWDRFALSAAADAVALGIPLLQVTSLLDLCPRADTYVLVDLNPEAALERKTGVSLAECGGPEFLSLHRTKESAFLHFQQRIRDAYRTLAKHVGARSRVLIVDGSLPMSQLGDSILSALMGEPSPLTQHSP